MKPKIYIAKTLKNQDYGNIYEQLNNLSAIELECLNNDYGNVWCRDYMPIKTAMGNYVQFNYKPEYMNSLKWKKHIPDYKQLHNEIDIKNIFFSTIILDGGNVELYNKKAIVTDRIFRDNNAKNLEDQKNLDKKLRSALEVEKIIYIPQYPYDFTGHVDGLVRFVNDNTVLINNYLKEIKSIKDDKNNYRKKIMEQWHHSFMNILLNEGFNIKELTYNINENDNSSAVGIYLNFLLLEKIILMPAFNNTLKDEEAASILEKIYHKKVIPIYAKELAKKGGIINCISWTF